MLNLIISYASGLLAVTNLIMLVVNFINKRKDNTKKIVNGTQCLLRDRMTDIYYTHQKDKVFKEYERKNFDKLHDAYTALGGNSFIQDIYEEVRDWQTIR